jgi:hypothetical protein
VNELETPWEPARRRRAPSCLSDWSLDRLRLGEVTDEERKRFGAHLTACPTCEQARAALADDRERFLAEADVPRLAADAIARAGGTAGARNQARVWLRRLMAPLALALTAGAAGAVLLPRKSADLEATRTKGSLSLQAYVKRAGAGGAGTLHIGEALYPGDRLRFLVRSDRDGFLTVLAVDGAAQVSLYYPQGDTPAPLRAGDPEPLPNAVELDGTLGREVVFAVRCPTAVPVATVLAAAARAVEPHRKAADPAAAIGPLDLGCAQTRYEIRKVAPGAGPPRR